MKLEDIRAKIEEYMGACNKAITDGDLNALSEAEASLKAAEQEYAKEKTADVLTECRNADSPVLKAAQMYRYSVIAHKAVKVDGVTVAYELTDREKQIDLKALTLHCKGVEGKQISVMWIYMVEKLNHLLCLRAAKELKLTDEQVRELKLNYGLSDKAKQVDMGNAVPTSNTQLLKLMQQVVDTILFEQGEKEGVNKYKVLSHDVAWLLLTYTSKGREGLQLKVSRDNRIQATMLDILHRIIMERGYSITGYATKKQKTAPEVSTSKKNDAKNDAAKVETVPRPEVSASVADELPAVDDIPAEEVA